MIIRLTLAQVNAVQRQAEAANLGISEYIGSLIDRDKALSTVHLPHCAVARLGWNGACTCADEPEEDPGQVGPR